MKRRIAHTAATALLVFALDQSCGTTQPGSPAAEADTTITFTGEWNMYNGSHAGTGTWTVTRDRDGKVIDHGSEKFGSFNFSHTSLIKGGQGGIRADLTLSSTGPVVGGGLSCGVDMDRFGGTVLHKHGGDRTTGASITCGVNS